MTHMHTESEPQERAEASAERVLERITSLGITPRPRWHFLLKDSVFWSVWVLSLVLGAMAVAGSLFVMDNIGWKYYAATHENLLTFLVAFLPFMWIVLLLVSCVIGYINIRHTKRGYRYPLWLILLIGVCGSVVGGSTLHVFGFGHEIDENIGRYMPMHRPLVSHQQELWLHPERGLLTGEVMEVSLAEERLVLRTVDGALVTVDTSGLAAPDFHTLAQKSQVRIVGLPQVVSDAVFYACFVFPWDIRRGMWGEDATMPHRGMYFAEEVREVLERNSERIRSTACRDVRPFEALEKLRQ